jgi:hypothetical protein
VIMRGEVNRGSCCDMDIPEERLGKFFRRSLLNTLINIRIL